MDRPPVSPSFTSTSNPFDKYNSARSILPAGVGGIGTGSIGRFSRKKLGERKRTVRTLIFASLVGLLLWFYITPLGGSKITISQHAPAPAATTHYRVPTKPKSKPKTVISNVLGDRAQIGKEKATILMLVRNHELEDALKSMKQIEDRFNRKFKYPWTFVNDVEFTEEFKRETFKRASGMVAYGVIPHEHWSIPEHINQGKMREAMSKMESEGVIYGGSLSYRHMCRYNSGFFWQEDFFKDYDWYWRVEPGIQFYCDVDYDPFEFMRTSGKKYGFTITFPEFRSTITTLWKQTIKFMRDNPSYLHPNSSLEYLLEDSSHGRTLDMDPPPEYNACHFWSNFEIASLNFWRSEPYRKYFEHLDRAGGFFYERWGDAPIHSMAAALFLGTQEVHHFADMGYKHNPFGRCPQPDEFHKYGKCMCPFPREDSFDLAEWSCQPRWWKIAGKEYGT
ncbi:hypothetical protein ABW19_dt0205891 [Dactylella cylindrospora]|nr:hypothetical protein ABW19_dt0205891 [Dactylella cylindrospora]